MLYCIYNTDYFMTGTRELRSSSGPALRTSSPAYLFWTFTACRSRGTSSHQSFVFYVSVDVDLLQRLYDRLWFFVTESLLAFTIFRDDFDIPFALMFGFLLFVKSFHWLASDRIEWVSVPSLLANILILTILQRWTKDLIQALPSFSMFG
jgi:hypothetical protein